MKRKEKSFLVIDRKGIVKENVCAEDIAGLIERQALVSVDSYSEPLFTSGKLERNFFTFLIILLEDYYSVEFSDSMLELETFDTVEKMVQIIVKLKRN